MLWTPTYTVVQELLAAKRDLDLPRKLRKLGHYDLLILDDIGYIKQSGDEAEVLFTLLAERYERRSTAITATTLRCGRHRRTITKEQTGKNSCPLPARIVDVDHSTAHAAAPDTVDVRGVVHYASYTRMKLSSRSTRVVVEIHAEPKGYIPDWLVNSIQRRWPLKTLDGLRRQARKDSLELRPLPLASR